MKKILPILAALLFAGTASFAQEQQWVEISALHMEATGGTDAEHTLKQFVLIDDDVLREHIDVYERLDAFSREFTQMTLNRVIPEAAKEADATIESLRKTAKENPELKDMIEEQIKAMEIVKQQYADATNPEFTSYSMDVKALLKDVLAISVNKKAYTGYRDLGNGLYAVTSAPRYGAAGSGSSFQVEVPESSIYTWGAIDKSGKVIIKPEYCEIRGNYEDIDLIILYRPGKNGKEIAGACGYDGRVRVPFEYTNLDTFRFGLIASKDGMQTCGVLTLDGKQVVPFKYAELWITGDEDFSMLRSDGLIDVYNSEYKLLRTKKEDAAGYSGEGKG